MPTIQHNVLTTTDLHEPKGISTATESMIYLADGAGSGTWTHFPTGWGYYKDDGVDQVVGTSEVKLSIDSLATVTEESWLPRAIRGTGSLWNSTTNKLEPILAGDTYDIRLDIPITAKSGTPTELDVQLDIGGAASSTIVIFDRFLTTSKTPPYTFSIGFPVFCGTTFKANGGQIFVKADTGTLTISKPGITIVRNHSGGI